MRRAGEKGAGRNYRSKAVTLIILVGLFSMMADVATDGSRSAMGAHLGFLGASAIIVSFMAGLGELLNYGLRVVFGKLTDHTGNYWVPLLIGYGINLIAIPALALTGNWMEAMWLFMLERLGRAVRSPARDAIISHAGYSMGRGWAYGLQEALSSVGGMVGPIVIVAVLALGGDYQTGFIILFLPSLVAILLLVYTMKVEPCPRQLEPILDPGRGTRLPRTFWTYILATSLIAAGYVDFPLMVMHIDAFTGTSGGLTALMFATVTASGGISSMVFGRSYDRIGMLPLIGVSAIVPLFIPMIFSNEASHIVLGMVLYGVGIGAQGSVVRAVVADMTPVSGRATAFGMFNAAFGISWFLGSVVLGTLYGISLAAMMTLSIGLQLAAVPLMIHVMKERPFAIKPDAGEMLTGQ